MIYLNTHNIYYRVTFRVVCERAVSVISQSHPFARLYYAGATPPRPVKQTVQHFTKSRGRDYLLHIVMQLSLLLCQLYCILLWRCLYDLLDSVLEVAPDLIASQNRIILLFWDSLFEEVLVSSLLNLDFFLCTTFVLQNFISLVQKSRSIAYLTILVFKSSNARDFVLFTCFHNNATCQCQYCLDLL